jgi:predicted RNase H-like HicB family nuclease
MTSTLIVSIEINDVVHSIGGGGFWAEVPCFPGCVAQAETLESLKEHLRAAIADWLFDSPVKTEEEARQFATIQGSDEPVDKTFPQPYAYLAPTPEI